MTEQSIVWHRLSSTCLPPHGVWFVLSSDTKAKKIWYRQSEEYINIIKTRMSRILHRNPVDAGIWDVYGLPKIQRHEGTRWVFWAELPDVPNE